MSGFASRPLHLHTLDSLCADLVSGRAILVGSDRTVFALADDRTRAALQWYRQRGAANWSASVTAQHAEQLVDAIHTPPPEIPALPARAADAATRRLTLKKLEAHRFAGLHKFGTPSAAPANYVHEFSTPVALFEGANGSGKTSLANAIIWTLTGEILRPQREPEKGTEEFECWIAGDEPGQQTTHLLSPVTPLPRRDEFRPDNDWVPADTWVELTFVDEKGARISVRRTQTRTKGKLTESPPELHLLGVDPIALRIGTVMPGLLPLIRVGSESQLGKAVSELTGLSALVDLADHVRRAKQKIDKEFVKARWQEIKNADESYERSRGDLEKEIRENPAIAPPRALPSPSSNSSIEEILQEITTYLETAKATALSSAQAILGATFDPSVPEMRRDLEANVLVALNEVKQLGRMPAMTRLADLRKISATELSAIKKRVSELIDEAIALKDLAANPDRAARARLYAHVAMWMADHPNPNRDENKCTVCGESLEGKLDPTTGKPVKEHLHEARSDAELLSQTLSQWAKAALNELSRTLPAALQKEINADLPAHPCDLMRPALVDELFGTTPFLGVLAVLKDGVAKEFDQAVSGRTDIAAAKKVSLPRECAPLEKALERIQRAVNFVEWRQANDSFVQKLYERAVGPMPQSKSAAEATSITAKLDALDVVVKGAAPLTRALEACNRLKKDLEKRRVAERRLKQYETASAALGSLSQLGDLADMQVEDLRVQLRAEANTWRNRIYLGAFPSTAHELVDAKMSRRGELDLVVGSAGVSAPAQHVANASALRASLVGFFLAFWAHVLKERGGLRLLVLDDPQELLDDDNRERLANSFTELLKSEAQIVATTCDGRFAAHVTRLPERSSVEHRAVFPATEIQPVIRTPFSEAELFKKKKLFEADRNEIEPAQGYAGACREYLEALLGDLFDDPAYSVWMRSTPAPVLSDYVKRIRSLVGSSSQGMFSATVFRDFANHSGLADNATTAKLLNKAHHGERHTIKPAEVAQCAEELESLAKLADKMHEECRRWRLRSKDAAATAPIKSLSSVATFAPKQHKIMICPDLAAFTGQDSSGESQEIVEELPFGLFDSKALYYLRRDNYGFSAPNGAIAIVEADPLPVADRRLVIARHGEDVYARRLLRSDDSDVIGLTAETPDPRSSPRTLFFPAMDVSLHQVVGVVLRHSIRIGPGKEEAVLVEDTEILKGIEVAYRIKEESAVPLALPKQIVLGGPCIKLDELSQHRDALVALGLDNGSSLFKRVGSTLPGSLNHLRQFESIGGLGTSQVLAVGKQEKGVQSIARARLIIGVLYHG